MEAVKPGDKVMLKSGGPDMTVSTDMSQAVGANHFKCQWFHLSALHEGIFHADALVKIGG